MKSPESFQLGLEIERGFDRRAPPLCSSYRVVKNGLRENIGDRYILYGLWNRLFGCWMVSAKSPLTDHQEIVPDWPILAPASDRAQVDNMSVLRHWSPFGDRQIVLGKRSSYHFSHCLDSIPTVIQNLCRPFGSSQWLALDVIRQVQGFMWFLLGERQEGRLGYVAACLVGFSESGSHDRKARRDFGAEIMHKPRRDVLSAVYGSHVSKSVVRIFERLPASITFSDVQRVLQALEDEGSANALRYAEQVSMEIVEALLELPLDFRSPNVSVLIAAGASASRLEHDITMVCSNLTSSQRRAASREFGHIQTIADLSSWGQKWLRVGRLNQPYPTAPLHSQPPLKPITSFKELKEEGRSMRNCVASYIDEVLSGDVYFYHWDGDEPASVCVVSTPGGDWFVEQALGCRNQTLSEKTSRLIERHLMMSNTD